MLWHGGHWNDNREARQWERGPAHPTVTECLLHWANGCFFFLIMKHEKIIEHEKKFLLTYTLSSQIRTCVKSLSCVLLFVTPWIVACQTPPSMGFSRQEYGSGLPFPSPGNLPDPGFEPGSPALQTDSWPIEVPGNPTNKDCHTQRSF